MLAYSSGSARKSAMPALWWHALQFLLRPGSTVFSNISRRDAKVSPVGVEVAPPAPPSPPAPPELVFVVVVAPEPPVPSSPEQPDAAGRIEISATNGKMVSADDCPTSREAGSKPARSRQAEGFIIHIVSRHDRAEQQPNRRKKLRRQKSSCTHWAQPSTAQKCVLHGFFEACCLDNRGSGG